MFSSSQTKHRLDHLYIQFESNQTHTWQHTCSRWVRLNTTLSNYMFSLSSNEHKLDNIMFSFRVGREVCSWHLAPLHRIYVHNTTYQVDIIRMIIKMHSQYRWPPLFNCTWRNGVQELHRRLNLRARPNPPAGKHALRRYAKLCVCVASADASRLPTCRHLNHTNDESHHSKMRGK